MRCFHQNIFSTFSFEVDDVRPARMHSTACSRIQFNAIEFVRMHLNSNVRHVCMHIKPEEDTTRLLMHLFMIKHSCVRIFIIIMNLLQNTSISDGLIFHNTEHSSKPTMINPRLLEPVRCSGDICMTNEKYGDVG
jgi:hypothetical protein